VKTPGRSCWVSCGKTERPHADPLRSPYGAAGLRAAVIVAHPDDETLWAGGVILTHRDCSWYVASLCRGGDPDRSPRFLRALQDLGAAGRMANLDDGPLQRPLTAALIERTILDLLPQPQFDLILTHGPKGEYTHHLRHEETSRAVVALWKAGKVCCDCLWLFAYEDGAGQYLPKPVDGADLKFALPTKVWQEKHRIITEVYGFAPESFEARTTPRQEAFWRFHCATEVQDWIHRGGPGQ